VVADETVSGVPKQNLTTVVSIAVNILHFRRCPEVGSIGFVSACNKNNQFWRSLTNADFVHSQGSAPLRH
jgi:hypothetical protein